MSIQFVWKLKSRIQHMTPSEFINRSIEYAVIMKVFAERLDGRFTKLHVGNDACHLLLLSL